MAVYGIIMEWDEWDEYTTHDGEHLPRQEFYFASPDANAYIEVANLRQFYDDDLTEDLETHMAGRTEGRTRTLPMRFVRRYFALMEQQEGRRAIFDCRVYPPVSKEEMETGGLPEGTRYAGLGTQKAQAKA